MQEALQALFALIVALSALTGEPVDVGDAPDRPAIVQPVPGSAAAGNLLSASTARVPETVKAPATAANPFSTPTGATETTKAPVAASAKTPVPSTFEVKGAIQGIQGNVIIVNGQRITIAPNAQVKSKLTVGAVVQVEVFRQANGTVVAIEVEVKGGDDSKSEGTEMPEVKPTEKPEPKPTEKPEVKPTEKPKSKPTEKPEVKPTEKPEPKPTEKPEVKPTEKPESKPTEKPEVKPTGKPDDHHDDHDDHD
jgi:hypothetical protein